MALLLLFLIPSLAPALAQAVSVSIPRAEAVAAILGARESVFLSATYLRHYDLASALHKKAVAGTPVLILTSGYTYLDPASYFLGLHLAGAKVYLGVPPQYILVVDGLPLYRGRGLGASGPIEAIPEGERGKALDAFRVALAEARPLIASPEDIVRHFWR